MNYQEEVTANPFLLKMVGFEVPFHGRLWVPGDTGTEQADLQELLKASRIAGTVHVSMRETPRCRLFYGKKDLSDGEASLLAYAFQRTIALAYAAIGLDMTGLCVDADALTVLSKRDDPDT